MALSALPPPAKKARVEGDDMRGCIGCGVVGHTIDHCPYAAILLEAKALKSVEYEVTRATMCRHYQLGICKWGNECGFAHREADLNTPVRQSTDGAKTRTALCKYYKWGTCQYGTKCTYAHGEAALNTPITQPMSGTRGTASVVAGNTVNANPVQGGPFGAPPVELNNANIAEMIKVAEESADWLTQAATYCTSNSDAAKLDDLLWNAGQAAQRAVWVHGIVLNYEPPAETADAAKVATIRNAAIEAKKKAEKAYLSIQQIFDFAKAQTSSFELLLAQAQCNQAGDDWSQQPVQSKLPDVSILSLKCTKAWEQKTSQLEMEGFHPEGVAVLYSKNCDLFSDAHAILQTFGGNIYIKDFIAVEHDSDATEFPEVFQTWKAQGGEDWPMTIAKCRQFRKWGAGFAGKKNGEKAAKLALALSISRAVDSNKLDRVVAYYPEFGKLLTSGNH